MDWIPFFQVQTRNDKFGYIGAVSHSDTSVAAAWDGSIIILNVNKGGHGGKVRFESWNAPVVHEVAHHDAG